MGEDMLNTMKYISTVPFSELINWSVQYLNDSKIAFSKAYPMLRIGEFLNRSKKVVTIEDDKIYKRATIKIHNGGILLRDEKIGIEIGTKNQFLIFKGQFLLSKIDARNGAFGVVPEDLDGGIITGNFWTFDVDYRVINPHYLTLLTTTQAFIGFCEQASNGTTNRHYLQESLFLNIKVPVPSLEEQEELIAAYDKQISLAIDSELEIAAKQHDINNLLFNRLGVEITKNNPLKRLSVVSFSALQRWDHAYLQNNAKLKSVYPLIGLSDCIESFMKSADGKSLRMETYKAPSQEFHYIGMEHIEKSTGELIDMPIVKGEQIKSQTVAIPKGYFIYGKLRPYLNKYWYNNTDLNNIVCSSELFVFKIKDNINSRYFELVLGSDIVQRQIADMASGARMPRINEEVFMNIRIPIPPVEVQNNIIIHADKIKEEIKSLRRSALLNRTMAFTNFETRIFE